MQTTIARMSLRYSAAFEAQNYSPPFTKTGYWQVAEEFRTKESVVTTRMDLDLYLPRTDFN